MHDTITVSAAKVGQTTVIETDGRLEVFGTEVGFIGAFGGRWVFALLAFPTVFNRTSPPMTKTALTEAILAAKKSQKTTWVAIAKAAGISEVFTTSDSAPRSLKLSLNMPTRAKQPPPSARSRCNIAFKRSSMSMAPP